MARAYTLVLDWLETELRSGGLRIGDKLPGERQLAERFHISRASVREAVRVLDAMGLVRSATGSGPTAGALLVSEPSAALAWALRMHVATSALPACDIVATRLLLETQAAIAGAQRPADQDWQAAVARAGELLAAMDAPGLEPAEFHRLDAQFHETLCSLGGNVVVNTIMDSLHAATIGYVQETAALVGGWPQVAAQLQEQHHAIMAAVLKRDGEAAAAELRRHISWFYSLSQDL